MTDFISRDLYESISEDIDAATTREELEDLRAEVQAIKDAGNDDDEGGRVYKKR